MQVWSCLIADGQLSAIHCCVSCFMLPACSPTGNLVLLSLGEPLPDGRSYLRRRHIHYLNFYFPFPRKKDQVSSLSLSIPTCSDSTETVTRTGYSLVQFSLNKCNLFAIYVLCYAFVYFWIVAWVGLSFLTLFEMVVLWNCQFKSFNFGSYLSSVGHGALLLGLPQPPSIRPSLQIKSLKVGLFLLLLLLFLVQQPTICQ
jgi:hypothetical protein